MPRARTTAALSSVRSPEVAVRVHFGLSQQQLADWLGLGVGFVGTIEKGRRPLPAALTGRLLVLARLLPPPLGSGPPAPAPLLPHPPALPEAPRGALLPQGRSGPPTHWAPPPPACCAPPPAPLAWRPCSPSATCSAATPAPWPWRTGAGGWRSC